ncbi:MAG: DUF4115 domain-containing protein [Rhodobacteraceae bacterium]|nr:DUF4115 domain-containing protein [Paracoccaceae bacterium]
MMDRESATDGNEPRGWDDYEMRLGDEMRGLRASRDKSLLDVEQDLNIRASLVNAIERADLAAIEPKWLIPGHVRSYSRYLGMDPEQSYARFCRESGFEAKPADVSMRLGDQASSGIATHAKGRKFGSAKLAGMLGKGAPRRSKAASGEGPGISGIGEFGLVQRLFDRQFIQNLVSSGLVIAVVGGIGYVSWTVFDEIDNIVEANANTLPNLSDEFADAALASPDVRISSRVGGYEISAGGNPKMGEIIPGEFGIYVAPQVNPGLPVEAQLIDVGLTPAGQEQLAEPASEAVISDSITAETINAVAVAEGDVTFDGVTLVVSEPVWMRITTPEGSVFHEALLEAGAEFTLPSDSGGLLLRAGNSGSLYFRVGSETYGPAGTPGAVVKGVELTAAAIRNEFDQVSSDRVLPAVLNLGSVALASE